MIQSETIIACAGPAHKTSPVLPKVNCPICQDGEGPARFTRLALLTHLRDFHNRLDAVELCNTWCAKYGGE